MGNIFRYYSHSSKWVQSFRLIPLQRRYSTPQRRPCRSITAPKPLRYTKWRVRKPVLSWEHQLNDSTAHPTQKEKFLCTMSLTESTWEPQWCSTVRPGSVEIQLFRMHPAGTPSPTIPVLKPTHAGSEFEAWVEVTFSKLQKLYELKAFNRRFSAPSNIFRCKTQIDFVPRSEINVSVTC